MTIKRIHFNGILCVTKDTIDEKTSVVLLAVKNFAQDENILCSTSPETFLNDSLILIVSIGGDGTMLSAMRTALAYPKSIVFGINTGTLGFLSEEIITNEIATVFKKIETRNGLIEERMALRGEITVDGDMLNDNLVAINELSVVGMTLQRPLTVTVGINNKHVSEIKGSGVIVATSTGSTAMALSGGGAIISPSTNVMQIVPIMPHTLTSRPIITTGRDVITLSSELSSRSQPVEIYSDGNDLYTITADVHENVSLKIKKHKNKVKIYRPPEWSFFNVLREKMKW